MPVETPGLQKDSTVGQVMDTWPQTAPFFLEQRMGCIGCSMASFCTLEEASEHYALDLGTLIQGLNSLIIEQHQEATR
jgi:hybrid cluster-associated redox disulfide protein